MRKLMVAVLTLAAPLAAGCIDSNLGPPEDTVDSSTSPAIDGGTTPSDDGGNPTDPAVIAKGLFDSNVRPVFQANCVACHDRPTGGVGPGFLAPDMYASIKAYAGVMFFRPGDPSGSRLVTYAQPGSGHPGTALTGAQTTDVRAWISAEPRQLPATDGGVVMPTNPTTAPMTPVIGLNTMDLSALGSGLAGTQLTFMYERLTSGVYLTQITVKAGASAVHIKHPLFSVWTPAQTPDTVDTFYGMDMTVPAMGMQKIGGGTVFMQAPMNAQLSVNFEKIEMTTAMPDGGVPAGGCKNVASFTANARGPLSTSCASCHAGANAGASNAFDLRAVNDLSATGQAAACAQTRGKINLATVPMSILFQRVRPPQATNHPFTFQAAQSTAFENAVTIWANLEK